MTPLDHWNKAGELLEVVEDHLQQRTGSTPSNTVRVGCALVHAVMAGVGFKVPEYDELWKKTGIQDT